MTQNGPKMAQNDPKWPKYDPKWPKNYPKWPKYEILIFGGTYLRPKSKKKGSPFPLIFDVEAPFQRYMPKNEILAKKCPKNDILILGGPHP